MAKRIKISKTNDWSSFLKLNQDLVDNALAVLFAYYSQELLLSEYAKNHLIQPDLQSI